MHDTEEPRWIPVETRALDALRRAAREAHESREALRRATAALVEQAEDFSIDAARRLRERGASSAQIEAYEGAFVARRDAVHAAAHALDEALARWKDASPDYQ